MHLPAKIANLPIADNVRDAMQKIADIPVPTPEVHTFSLFKTVGRVLAQDIEAPFAVPGFLRSRLDGYAVCAATLANASQDNIISLPIGQTITAGMWPVLPLENNCARIMAGAPVPEGADAVVPFEFIASSTAEAAHFKASVAQGYGIGLPDIDVQQGEKLVSKGTRLEPVHLGRLASIGITNLGVYTRPRVAVLSTGNELLLPGMPPSPGKIFNSSQYVICSHLVRAGAVPLACGIAPDDAATIARTMALALHDNTMLITTGGVGYGDFDLIIEAMQLAKAKIIFASAHFRPGGNCAVALLNGKVILSLSGAPGSAVIALQLLGLPLVRRLTHDTNWAPQEIDVLLESVPSRFPKGLLPGKLCLNAGKAFFRPMQTLHLERESFDLIVPLQGDEDLERIVHEQTPIRAFKVN